MDIAGKTGVHVQGCMCAYEKAGGRDSVGIAASRYAI